MIAGDVPAATFATRRTWPSCCGLPAGLSRGKNANDEPSVVHQLPSRTCGDSPNAVSPLLASERTGPNGPSRTIRIRIETNGTELGHVALAKPGPLLQHILVRPSATATRAVTVMPSHSTSSTNSKMPRRQPSRLPGRTGGERSRHVATPIAIESITPPA